MPKYRCYYDSTRVYGTWVDVDAATEEEANDLAMDLVTGNIDEDDPRYQEIEWHYEECLEVDHIKTKLAPVDP